MPFQRTLPRTLLSVTLMSLALAGCGGGGGGGDSASTPPSGGGSGGGGSGGGSGGGGTTPATLTLAGGEERFVTRATDVTTDESTTGTRGARATSDQVDRLKTGDRVFREGDTSYFTLKQVTAGSYKVILPNGSEIALTWDATALAGAGAYTFQVTTGTTRVTYYLAVAANRITGVTLTITDIRDPANPQTLGEVAVEVQAPPSIPDSVVGTYPASAFGTFFGSSNATVSIDAFGVMTVRKPGEEPVIYQMALNDDGKFVAQSSYLEDEVQNTDGGAPESSPGDLASDKFVFGIQEGQPLEVEELVYEAMPKDLFEDFLDAVLAGDDAEDIADKLAQLIDASFEAPVEVMTPPEKLEVDASTVEALSQISGAYVLRQTAGTFPAGVENGDLEDQDGLTWLAYLGVDGAIAFYDAESGWDNSMTVNEDGITITSTLITITYSNVFGDELTLTATKGNTGTWTLTAAQSNFDNEVLEESFTYALSTAPALVTSNVGLRVTQVEGTHFHQMVNDVIAGQFDGAIFLVVGGPNPVGIALRQLDSTTLQGTRVEDRGEEGMFQEVFTVTLAAGVPVSGVVRAYAVTEVAGDVVVGTEVLASMTMQVDALPDTADLVGTYVLRDQSYEQLADDEDLGMAIGNSVAIADLYPDNSLGLWEAENQEWTLLEHPVPGQTEDGLKTLTWLKPEETAEARITAVLAQDGQSLLRVTWIYESFIEGDEDYGEDRDAGTLSITKVTRAVESKLGVLTVTAVTAGENPLAGLLDLPPVNDLSRLDMVPGGLLLNGDVIPAIEDPQGNLVAQWTDEPIAVRALPIEESLPAGGVPIEGAADMTGVSITRAEDAITVQVQFADPVNPAQLVPGKNNGRISLQVGFDQDGGTEFSCWHWSSMVQKYVSGSDNQVSVQGSSVTWGEDNLTFTVPLSELPTSASLRLEVFYWNSDTDRGSVDEIDFGMYDLDATEDRSLPAIAQILTVARDAKGLPTGGTATFHQVVDRVPATETLATIAFTVTVPDETLTTAVDALISMGGLVGFQSTHLLDETDGLGVDLGGAISRIDLEDLPSPSDTIATGGVVGTATDGATSTVTLRWVKESEGASPLDITTIYTVVGGNVTAIDQIERDADTGATVKRRAGTFTTLPAIADGWYTMTLAADITFTVPDGEDTGISAGSVLANVQVLNGLVSVVWSDSSDPFGESPFAVVHEGDAAVSRIIGYDIAWDMGPDPILLGLWSDRYVWNLNANGVPTGLTLQPQEAAVDGATIGAFTNTLVEGAATFTLAPKEWDTTGSVEDPAELSAEDPNLGLDVIGMSVEGAIDEFTPNVSVSLSVILSAGPIPDGSSLSTNISRRNGAHPDGAVEELVALYVFRQDGAWRWWNDDMEVELQETVNEQGQVTLTFDFTVSPESNVDVRGMWLAMVSMSSRDINDDWIEVDKSGPVAFTIDKTPHGPGYENLAVVAAFRDEGPRGLLTSTLDYGNQDSFAGQTVQIDPAKFPTQDMVLALGGSVSYSSESVTMAWVEDEWIGHEVTWTITNGQVTAMSMSEEYVQAEGIPHLLMAGDIVPLATVADGWFTMTVAEDVVDQSTETPTTITAGTVIGLLQIKDGMVHALFERGAYADDVEPTAILNIDGEVRSETVRADYYYDGQMMQLREMKRDRFVWTVTNGVATGVEFLATSASVTDGVLDEFTSHLDPSSVTVTLTPRAAPPTANAADDALGDGNVEGLDIADSDVTASIDLDGNVTLTVEAVLVPIEGGFPSGTVINAEFTRLKESGDGQVEWLAYVAMTFDGVAWSAVSNGTNTPVTLNEGANTGISTVVTLSREALHGIDPRGTWLLDLTTAIEDDLGNRTDGDRATPRFIPVTAAVVAE